MPFSLCNAPVIFVRLMHKVLKDLIGRICMVYLDDIIIIGKTFLEMTKNLKVIQSLRSAGLRLKAKIFDFFILKEGLLLGAMQCHFPE